jgi:hypothetical protein
MWHHRTSQRRADEAALGAYFRSRREGQAHHRALSAAILGWIANAGWADGRDARAHVLAELRAHGVVPVDHEDWIATAPFSEAWQHGAKAAIRRLSAECRVIALRPAGAEDGDRGSDFESIGADVMPAKVARLRDQALRLFGRAGGAC